MQLYIVIYNLLLYNIIYIYIMKYNSALKKKEILPFAKTWIDLESIMLGDIKQKEKDKYYMFSLLCEIKKTSEK